MGKNERLKSRKLIDRVFREGKSFALFPFRVYYAPLPSRGGNAASAGAAGTVTGTVKPDADAGAPTGAMPGTTAMASPTDTVIAPTTIEPTVPAPTATAVAPTTVEPTAPAPTASRLQAGFGASSRNFKKAVDRNRIKRLTREAYRLQKPILQEWLSKKDRSLALFFIYTGKELPDYEVVKEKIGLALQKLMKEPGS